MQQMINWVTSCYTSNIAAKLGEIFIGKRPKVLSFFNQKCFSTYLEICPFFSAGHLRCQLLVSIKLKHSRAHFKMQKVYPGLGRARNHLWSDLPRQVGPLVRPSQTEMTSDQTSMRSKIIVRSKCARSRLWSDELQTEVTPDQTSSRPLSRRVPDHCPD